VLPTTSSRASGPSGRQRAWRRASTSSGSRFTGPSSRVRPVHATAVGLCGPHKDPGGLKVCRASIRRFPPSRVACVNTTAAKLAELERRRAIAVAEPEENARTKQHARGKKTARERIDALLDEGSFTELD